MTKIVTYALALVGLGTLLTFPQVQGELRAAGERALKLRASIVASAMAAPDDTKFEPGTEGGAKQSPSPMVRTNESESDLPVPAQEDSDASGTQKALDFYQEQATKNTSKSG